MVAIQCTRSNVCSKSCCHPTLHCQNRCIHNPCNLHSSFICCIALGAQFCGSSKSPNSCLERSTQPGHNLVFDIRPTCGWRCKQPAEIICVIVGWWKHLDDVKLVDLLLHPADVAYTVPTLMHLVKSAGLNLLRCAHEPAINLPISTFVPLFTSIGTHLAMVHCSNAHVFDILIRCSSQPTPDHSSCHSHQLGCSNQRFHENLSQVSRTCSLFACNIC